MVSAEKERTALLSLFAALLFTEPDRYALATVSRWRI
jgi:hypothetical protein